MSDAFQTDVLGVYVSRLFKYWKQTQLIGSISAIAIIKHQGYKYVGGIIFQIRRLRVRCGCVLILQSCT